MLSKLEKRAALARLGSFAAAPLLLAALLLGCEGRPRVAAAADELRSSDTEPHVAELDLRNGVPERSEVSLFGGPSAGSFAELVLELRSMQDQDRIQGLFVRLGATSFGLSRAREIGELLGGFRSRALPVVCHADEYTNSSIMLAALGCDEIWLSPAGGVDSVGLAAQLLFGQPLLDKLSVDADYVQIGKYKGASEPFTRSGPSPEARESLQTALTAIRRAWVDGVEQGRARTAAELHLEDGPHTPPAAKELGLIDSIGFEREALDHTLERAGAGKNRVPYFGGASTEGGGIAELLRALSGTAAEASDHVAVVRAVGAITTTGGGSPLSGGDGIEQRSLGKLLDRLRRDDAVKAVVLRIDSPGGSALASDLLWKSMMDLRAAKPLVVSVGDMAASGGYYLACAATKVVADPGSIIGSIGVVAGKLSMRRALADAGVHVETIPARTDHGQRAAYLSPLVEWDEPTRDKVLASAQHMYDLFISRIHEGRGLEQGALDAYAEGRIMGSELALQGRLVDEVGGFTRALALATELAGLPEDIPVHLVDKQANPLLAALGVEPDVGAQGEPGGAVRRHASREAAQVLLGVFGPNAAHLRAHVGSLAPLLSDERVVAALPFALTVR